MNEYSIIKKGSMTDIITSMYRRNKLTSAARLWFKTKLITFRTYTGFVSENNYYIVQVMNRVVLSHSLR